MIYDVIVYLCLIICLFQMFTDTRIRLIQIMSYCLDGWMCVCVCMLIAFYSANVNECSERYVTLVFLVYLDRLAL